MSLFEYGDFTLNSGAKAKWKIECDALTVADLRALAFMAAQVLPPFYAAVGVPRGGTVLAEAVNEYKSHGPWLVVDDVLTTGGSMERQRARLDTANGPTLGLVLFARGPCPPWVRALFQLPQELWVKRV